LNRDQPIGYTADIRFHGRRQKNSEKFVENFSNYTARHGPESMPFQMIDDSVSYDASRYMELLAAVVNTITMPFGWTLGRAGSGTCKL
jgi:hypothetical protein